MSSSFLFTKAPSSKAPSAKTPTSKAASINASSPDAASLNAKASGLYRQYFRRGPDYRFGDDVDFVDIKQQFGFRSIEVGAWVTREERQLAANLLFDAFADLAFMLALPPAAIGLRESLALAFGRGGQRGVQAHYAPGSATLALAKNAGAGALAHEWWHALDNHLAGKAFEEPGRANAFASRRWLHDEPLTDHPLNHCLHRLFAAVLLSGDLNQPSQLVKDGLALDRDNGTRYFSQPEELTARAFEGWLQGREDIKNQYLVSGTKQGELAQSGAFPRGEQQQRYATAASEYFAELAAILAP